MPIRAHAARHVRSSSTLGDTVSSPVDRGIGKLPNDQVLRLKLKIDQPDAPRLLRVAIIGTPNSGKSTLINQLMAWKVFAVSSKVHTTRKNSLGVYTHGHTQLVFVDTPGIIPLEAARRIKLEQSMLVDPHASLAHADLVGVLVDVSNRWTRSALDPEILKVLHLNPTVPSVLILNKVDAVKDKVGLLEITRSLTAGIVRGKATHSMKVTRFQKKISAKEMLNELENRTRKDDEDGSNEGDASSEVTLRRDGYHLWLTNQITGKHNAAYDGGEVDLQEQMELLKSMIQGKNGWDKFRDVFMISALTGDGVDRLRDYLLECAQPCDWLYHSSLVTNQSPTDLAKRFVLEKFMDRLHDEVPYTLKLEVVLWEVDEASGLMKIIIDVICPTKRYFKLVLGPGGATIAAVAADAKQELLNAFRTDIVFKLQAKLVEKGK